MTRHVILSSAFVMVAQLVFVGGASALKVGDTVKNVQVRDANDNSAVIPDLGKKVVLLYYTDPDVKDQNEPVRDLIKAQNFDKGKLRALGVANLKDTWKPNFIIRKVVRSKIEKFQSTILTDKDHTLKNAWNLGTTDERDIMVVIDRARKVRYFKDRALTVAEQKEVVELLRKLISEK